MSLFGWLDGSFTNLTTQWLPNDANDIGGCGGLVSGDFNGDGLTDIFISGNADMDHINAYVLMNQNDHFIKKSQGSTWWQHGADVADNNDGYDDVFATGYNQGYAFYFGSDRGYWNTRLPTTGWATARVWLWGTSSITVKCKPSPLTQPKPTPKTRCSWKSPWTTRRAP